MKLTMIYIHRVECKPMSDSDSDSEEAQEAIFVPEPIVYSDEQKAIARAVSEGHNVVCDAVSGSGKTSTISLIVKNNPQKTFLVLCYNRALADASSNRIPRNANVRTIHS